MAKNILAVSPRPSNPVSQLAYLIHTAMDTRKGHSDNFPTEYKQQFCTLVGLGFAAVLAEGSKTKSFRLSLATFLRYLNLTRHPEKFAKLSEALAEMTCHAIYPFKVLGFPRYYDDFLSAMMRTASPSDTISTEIKNGIQEILLELLDKCD